MYNVHNQSVNSPTDSHVNWSDNISVTHSQFLYNKPSKRKVWQVNKHVTEADNYFLTWGEYLIIENGALN